MNQFGGQQSSHEQSPSASPSVNEIPSYPLAQEQYIPVPEQQVAQPKPAEQYVYPPLRAKVEQMPTQNTEAQSYYSVPEAQEVPVSKVPELQTQLDYKTTKEGERVFNNPDLGQSSFKGGVTSQQLVSKVAGYYTVNQGLIADPHSGLLQQTAKTGSATQATTWQAVVLLKILQAFWRSMGIA
jgi:hypothetical protein